MRPLSTIASSTRKIFKDNFNRSNTSTSLETSSDGGLWNAIRGTFKVTTNKAQSTDLASTYPLATTVMPKSNVAISLKGVSQGSTAALWVTDSNQWWAVGIDQTQVSASTLSPSERTLIGCNCQTCANVATCSTWNYQCNTWNYQCNTWNYQCNVWNYQCNVYNYQCNSASYPAASYNYNCNVYNGGFCNNSVRYPMVGPRAWVYTCNVVGNRYCNNSMYPIASYNYSCNSASQPCNSSSQPCNSTSQPCNVFSQPCNVFSQPCNANNTVTFYECNCQTCYPQYVRFIQSVSGTVTTLTSWIVSTVVNSIKVTTSGSGTTTKIYSDTNLVTQIGSDLTYTPTGVTVTPQYGIMVKPSSYLQGNTIEEITIEVN
jgi:hypothetical protein